MGMSDWLESGVLNFLFRSNTNSFSSPGNISIALCSGVPQDHHTGANLPEIFSGVNGVSNGYTRYNLGSPLNATWNEVNSSGFIHNLSDVSFPACANNAWGVVSGVAIVNHSGFLKGQVLFHGTLAEARSIGTGDVFKINTGDLDINLF